MEAWAWGDVPVAPMEGGVIALHWVLVTVTCRTVKEAAWLGGVGDPTVVMIMG